ncbi:amidohydrolase family protein [Vibrio pectenicida]|uniref:Amidohydrolase n=1 Tax=Vibrio pectenicida TaxID=62763 RepID=A0A3R9F3P2_9VIBR|nr:amidohydrolase family protein [Vibrio pectenicida]RSD28313.1 amidohydrolase [Vibrio pectenicida]
MKYLAMFICLIAEFSAWASEREYTYTDSHQHFLNFVQDTQGITALVDNMDAANIEYSMLSGMPMIKKLSSTDPKPTPYYLGNNSPVYWYSMTDEILARALESLPDNTRKRFIPFMSGFNPTDMNAVDHLRKLLEWRPGFWRGIGEVMTRHDDLTNLTYGEVARANHPAMFKIYALAAEYNLPVLVHSNITSASQAEFEPIYLTEIEEAVKNSPNTKLIWAHAGAATRINKKGLPYLPAEVRKLLDKYDNLYIDLSWAVLKSQLLDVNGKPVDKWVQLVSDYPDKFMIGTDQVGQFSGLKRTIERYNVFLDALPEATARRVSRDNFLSLCGFI